MLLRRLFFLLKAIYIIETLINIYSLFTWSAPQSCIVLHPKVFIADSSVVSFSLSPFSPMPCVTAQGEDRPAPTSSAVCSLMNLLLHHLLLRELLLRWADGGSPTWRQFLTVATPLRLWPLLEVCPWRHFVIQRTTSKTFFLVKPCVLALCKIGHYTISRSYPICPIWKSRHGICFRSLKDLIQMQEPVPIIAEDIMFSIGSELVS